MLKGISPLLTPELLKILAEMGHGDEIVICDWNFPCTSANARCIRADGCGAAEMLDAVMRLLPLDDFVEKPIAFMEVVPGTLDHEPPIWRVFREIVAKHERAAEPEMLERFAFYERAKKAYAVIQTGERAFYSNILITKGVTRPQD